MKALNYGVAFLLAFTIALCFAYKRKLQGANRYIDKVNSDVRKFENLWKQSVADHAVHMHTHK